MDPASAAADELYGLPLESFTGERNRVAAELRQAGEKEAARAVGALAKPTLAAWAVNQLARSDAREVDLLLDASHRLIETQGARQRRDELAAAQQRQRLALENLVRKARRVLGARATEPTMRKVAETLRSASITPDGRELLARGRLTDALSSTGWDVVVAKAAATPAAPKGTRKGSAAPAAAARARVAKAREELRLAREAHAEAKRRLREAEVERDRVRTQLRQAERKLDQLERALAAADEALNAAKSRLDDLHEDR